MNAREVLIIAFTPLYWTLGCLAVLASLWVLQIGVIDREPLFVIFTSTIGYVISALALKISWSAMTGYFVDNVDLPLQPGSVFTRRAKLLGVVFILLFVSLIFFLPLLKANQSINPTLSSAHIE